MMTAPCTAGAAAMRPRRFCGCLTKRTPPTAMK
nr:MAG TPA: hypothetical protein [Caudoviricetes sp.]